MALQIYVNPIYFLTSTVAACYQHEIYFCLHPYMRLLKNSSELELAMLRVSSSFFEFKEGINISTLTVLGHYCHMILIAWSDLWRAITCLQPFLTHITWTHMTAVPLSCITKLHAQSVSSVGLVSISVHQCKQGTFFVKWIVIKLFEQSVKLNMMLSCRLNASRSGYTHSPQQECFSWSSLQCIVTGFEEEYMMCRAPRGAMGLKL